MEEERVFFFGWSSYSNVITGKALDCEVMAKECKQFCSGWGKKHHLNLMSGGENININVM